MQEALQAPRVSQELHIKLGEEELTIITNVRAQQTFAITEVTGVKIDGKTISLTAEQRDLLKALVERLAYYDSLTRYAAGSKLGNVGVYLESKFAEAMRRSYEMRISILLDPRKAKKELEKKRANEIVALFLNIATAAKRLPSFFNLELRSSLKSLFARLKFIK